MTENVKEAVEVKATVAPTLDSIIKRVNELVKEREKFETVTLARSNKELYGILGKVQSLFLDASKDGKCLKESLEHLKGILNSRGLKFKLILLLLQSLFAMCLTVTVSVPTTTPVP